ncbi:MAG TPA: CotH kinase family protein [Verrucomicrobiae bacterium]|nr:CotH kinase family protein [Verrucomicrobiae bacterium]
MHILTRFGIRPSAVVGCWLGLGMALAGNAAEKDVIINEVMYHPPLDLEELQYVELFNRGDSTVDLSKWSFSKGITYTFPNGTKLGAGEFLVVCRNTRVFGGNYGNQIPAVGDFTGKLSHHGEKIELSNAAGLTIDSVKYSEAAPWPAAPNGHSPSLERINPFGPSHEAANWASSAMPPFERPGGSPGRRNDSYLAKLPPGISDVAFKTPPPEAPATITAQVSDGAAVKSVSLLWSVASTGNPGLEKEIAMQRVSGDERKGSYQAIIPGQPHGSLVRFRIKAANADTSRLAPGPNEPLPTFSYCTLANTNTARIPFAFIINVSHAPAESHARVWNGRSFDVRSAPTRADAAFIYVPPGGGEVLTFDHVYARRRKGGLKVHFKKEQSFKGMTGINVIFESSPRWLLSEPMAYELYRLAGVPACLTEHVRLWVDGRLYGYYLVIEQPNKAFLARNTRNDNGSLYKVYWMYQTLVDQHHKKTRPATEYDDLVGLEAGLTRTSGQQQWEFIRKNFNVDEFTGYYAVNMCIENWDGFFNNYYLYHDEKGTGKWEMYPWDEDKTWGDYDGASRNYDWYEMPLTYGMNEGRGRTNQRFFFGGFNGWQRPPGWFSGPLLANPEFRKAFLTRLNDICRNAFTEEKMLPLIDAMQKRLEPEIPVRARLTGQNPRELLGTFYNDIQSLRNQVKYRRQFILEQIPKDRAAP